MPLRQRTNHISKRRKTRKVYPAPISKKSGESCQPASQPAVGRSGCFVGDKTPVKTRSSSEITHQARNHPKPKEKNREKCRLFFTYGSFFCVATAPARFFVAKSSSSSPTKFVQHRHVRFFYFSVVYDVRCCMSEEIITLET